MKPIQKIRSIDYETISDFTMTIRYDETDPSIPISHKPRHIHATCEILIHISGDITFNIENNLYPVMPGNIIITRPYEYHNCIYRSNKPHKHFCIFLSTQNNEYLYDLFYNRNAGENNLLILPGEDAEKVIRLCHDMISVKGSQFDEYARFFRLMQYLQKAEAPDIVQHLHEDIIKALRYINDHLAERITIESLAKHTNVSINTLERHFHETLHMTPTEYIRQKRLSKAMEYLALSYNVSETCALCGFTDTSAFISQFRRELGMTPLQYKKSVSEKKKQ
ncbi:MAG: helix-turn-helix domain-containing protein [Clostridia bacterium]|nr:helix-turn-helix domain-containing protein [Clostridia bacterium]